MCYISQQDDKFQALDVAKVRLFLQMDSLFDRVDLSPLTFEYSPLWFVLIHHEQRFCGIGESSQGSIDWYLYYNVGRSLSEPDLRPII